MQSACLCLCIYSATIEFPHFTSSINYCLSFLWQRLRDKTGRPVRGIYHPLLPSLFYPAISSRVKNRSLLHISLSAVSESQRYIPEFLTSPAYCPVSQELLQHQGSIWNPSYQVAIFTLLSFFLKLVEISVLVVHCCPSLYAPYYHFFHNSHYICKDIKTRPL